MNDEPTKPAESQPTTAPVPPPVDPPGPYLLDDAGHKTTLRPSYAATVNVGDFITRLGDGTGCPAGHWPVLLNNPEASRREFAAHFVGMSATHADPNRPRHGAGPVDLLTIQTGGNWLVRTRGTVAKGDPLGPAIIDGKLSPLLLEACPKDSSIGVAVAPDIEGWKVKMRDPLAPPPVE